MWEGANPKTDDSTDKLRESNNDKLGSKIQNTFANVIYELSLKAVVGLGTSVILRHRL